MKKLSLIAIALLLSGCARIMIDQPAITQDELKAHISYLASDELKGRKPGTAEADQAAAYLADHFKKFGLKPMGNQGFQYFDVVTSIKAGSANRLQVGDSLYTAGKQFTPLALSGNDSALAEVVFAGYGLDVKTDEITWQDYTGLDVKAKYAMVLLDHPDLDNPHSPFDMHSDLRKKALTARDQGAAGLIIVAGTKSEAKDILLPLIYDQSQSDAGLPVFQIKRKVADQVLAASGKTITALEAALVESRQPASFATGTEINARIEVVQQKVTTQNVIALLEGSDPNLKNEFVVIGAHYDHLGFGGPGSGSRRPDTVAVHNGADDNASGVATLLELAERLAAERKNIKRSVLFMAFGAEEMGLLGSKYFTKHALINLKDINILFNFDMVGRLNEDKDLTIGGTGTAVGLDSLLKLQPNTAGLTLKFSPEGYGPSDHAAFYVEDVPVLFFFTGVHDDYHTPADDVDKINFDGQKMVSDYGYDLVMAMAGNGPKLIFKEAGPKGPQGGRARFKVTLGIVPDYASTAENGLRIDGVINERPAARAGMKKGDIIIMMAGKPVKNIYDYMYRLAELKVGERINIDVLRDGKKEILIVEL